ncbi:MAG: 30S ribosomal protein S6 [Patescibacteria group bacterium]
MYKYELATIIACESLSEEETQTVIGRIRELISDCHGRIIKEDLWGQKELTYPIKKQNHGFYMITQVNFEPTEVPTFEAKLRLLEGCLRYLLINLDREPGYNEQQQNDLDRANQDADNQISIPATESDSVEETTEKKPAVKKEVAKKTKIVKKVVKKETPAEETTKPAAKKSAPKVEAPEETVKETPVETPVKTEEEKKAKAENLDKILDEIL